MHKKIFGFVLFFFGLLLLAGNLRWFEPSFFLSLLQFWPLLLITPGLNLIFKKTTFARLGTLIIAFFLLLMLGVGVSAQYYLEQGSYWTVGPWQVGAAGISVSGHEQITNSESFKLPAVADSVSYKVDFAAGSLVIDGLDSTTHLLKAEFSAAKGSLPEVNINEGRQTVVNIQQGSLGFMPFSWRFGREQWQLSLNDSLPTKLDVDAGASDVKMNLESIPLETLELSTGAATVEITLGLEQRHSKVKIETGASTITLRIPDEMAVQMNYDGGLTTLNVPDDFDKLGSGKYESENYGGKADHQLALDIDSDSGAATIKVERYKVGSEGVDDPAEDPEIDSNTLQFDRLTGGAMNPIGYDQPEPMIYVVKDYLAAHPEASRLESVLGVYREPDSAGTLELLILQGQKNTGGYAITAEEVRLDQGKLIIVALQREPSRQDIVTQALTSPYEVISLPLDELPLLREPLAIELVDANGKTLATASYGGEE